MSMLGGHRYFGVFKGWPYEKGFACSWGACVIHADMMHGNSCMYASKSLLESMKARVFTLGCPESS